MDIEIEGTQKNGERGYSRDFFRKPLLTKEEQRCGSVSANSVDMNMYRRPSPYIYPRFGSS